MHVGCLKHPLFAERSSVDEGGTMLHRISPLEGEMSGGTEGGIRNASANDYTVKCRRASGVSSVSAGPSCTISPRSMI